MAFYLPGVTRVPGNDSGTYTSPVDKLLIHTTEGSSIEGAVAAYVANNSWPHVTVDARYGRTYRVVQHVDFARPARALRNESGGVQTNRDGVIQFEVVGAAARPGEIDWEWLGANVFGPAARLMGIPVESSVSWVAYPASYGKSAAQRLSAAAWTGYRGFLGHQHVPENSHGDPGAIPIDTVLRAAGATPAPAPTPTPVQEDDDMAAFARRRGERKVYLIEAGTRVHINSEAAVKEIAAERPEIRHAGRNAAGVPQALEWEPWHVDIYPPRRGIVNGVDIDA